MLQRADAFNVIEKTGPRCSPNDDSSRSRVESEEREKQKGEWERIQDLNGFRRNSTCRHVSEEIVIDKKKNWRGHDFTNKAVGTALPIEFS